MSRVNDRIRLDAFLAQTSNSGTRTVYFPIGNRPVFFKQAYLMGINPSSVNGDTLRARWDYTINGGSNWTTLVDSNAEEYNDTDDDLGLGDIGDSSAASVALSDEEMSVRIPANAIIRYRELLAGTVTNHQCHAFAEVIVA